jgi:hypothetical protein
MRPPLARNEAGRATTKGGVALGPDAPAEHGDTWQASGCHPTTLCAIAEWLTTHERTSQGLVLPSRDGWPASNLPSILQWAKWLFDPSGDPTLRKFNSANQHPPWIPTVVQFTGKRDEWYVDHVGLRKKMEAIRRNGEPLQYKLEAPGPGLLDRLKGLLYACGPVALNVAIPEHFVLLYGIRGTCMYIFDPGASLYRRWGIPNMAKGDPTMPELSIVRADKVVYRSSAASFHNDLMIDADYEFEHVHLKSKTKGEYGPAKLINNIVVAEGYYFASCTPFPEFEQAPAPDGQGSKTVVPIRPPQAAAGAAAAPSPAAGPAPAPSPSPAPAPAPGPPAPPAAPGAPPAGQPGIIDRAAQRLEHLRELVTGLFGSEAQPARPTPPPNQPPGPATTAPSAPAPSAGPASRQPAGGNGTTRLEYARNASMLVRVIDTEDRPVSGATIDVLTADVKHTGVSTKDGWRSPKLYPDRYMVRVTWFHYGPDTGNTPASPRPVATVVNVGASNVEAKLRIADMRQARVLCHVVDHDGNRPIPDAAFEIVGQATGKTNEFGFIATKRFPPGEYELKVLKAGYGPLPKPGERLEEKPSTHRFFMGAGDQEYVVRLRSLAQRSPPAPQGKLCDPTMLQFELGFEAVKHEVNVSQSRQYRVGYKFVRRAMYGTWRLFDPCGTEVDTNREVLGVGDYLLDTKLLAEHAARSLDAAIGRWTVRLEIGDYFYDATFVYAVEATPRGTPPWEPARAPRHPDIKVTSSHVFVEHLHFVDWFNHEFRPKYAGVKHPTVKLYKRDAFIAPDPLSKERFIEVFDACEAFWDKELRLYQFVAFFLLFYNETGGTFVPRAEAFYKTTLRGRMKYLFEPEGEKRSYNDPKSHRQAGAQLAERGILTNPEDIEAWNSTTSFPIGAPDDVIKAAVECDFHKFRGRGLIQTTWRSNYKKTVDPLLAANEYKLVDELTDAELTHIIESDRRVFLPAVKNFWRSAPREAAMTRLAEFKGTVTEEENSLKKAFFTVGHLASGGVPYGHILAWRALTLLHALTRRHIVNPPRAPG